MFKLKLKDS